VERHLILLKSVSSISKKSTPDAVPIKFQDIYHAAGFSELMLTLRTHVSARITRPSIVIETTTEPKGLLADVLGSAATNISVIAAVPLAVTETVSAPSHPLEITIAAKTGTLLRLALLPLALLLRQALVNLLFDSLLSTAPNPCARKHSAPIKALAPRVVTEATITKHASAK
jgi:hypothetical protein